MAIITASAVAKLREKTNAPIMQCKEALIQSDGDMAKAEELLYISLGNKAIKSASRLASEGVVAAFIDKNTDGTTEGALVEMNCETDFVAKNHNFITFSKAIAELVSKKNPKNISILSKLSIGDKTVEEERLTMAGKIGENILIRRFSRFETKNRLITYLHDNRIGVIVEYKGMNEQIGKDVAMHIAAMKPVSLSSSDIPIELIQKERRISEQRAARSGKTAEISRMMIDGSIQKYIREISLLSQPFVKNDKQTIEQILKSTNTTVQRFVLFVVGGDMN